MQRFLISFDHTILATMSAKFFRYGWEGAYEEAVKNGYCRSLSGMIYAARRMPILYSGALVMRLIRIMLFNIKSILSMEEIFLALSAAIITPFVDTHMRACYNS